jgi:hypothetical protein
MEKIPPKSEGNTARKIGVEAAHGFGDNLFQVPLIRKLSEKHNCKIGVTVRPHCKDAFYNIPWIDEIIEIPGMHHGAKRMKQLGYKTTHQITQNVKFYEFKQRNNNHSLIDTPLWTGAELGLKPFDQRPIFIPTVEEVNAGTEICSDPRPTIAIESVYKSAQSWANKKAINSIVEQFKGHRILWLSNEGAPDLPNVDNLLRYSRRSIIMGLQCCEIFFSVGSGFFCASMALPPALQPQKIICLWSDSLYHYDEPITANGWHEDIVWVHNKWELEECLKSL